MTEKRTQNICEKGYKYYQAGDCPICELGKRPESNFLLKLSNPARNALIHEGIDTIQKLAMHTEKEILKIHGIGRASLPVMRSCLEEAGLTFKA